MSQASVWSMADLATPMAIRVAATLRLADHVAGGADELTVLAERTGVTAELLVRLLRCLTEAGVVELVENGRRCTVALTDLGEQLLDRPGSARAWLDIDAAVGRADLAFVRLLDSIRTGEPGYASVHGTDLWTDLDTHPGLSRTFDELMGRHPAVAEIVDGYDWSGVRSVVDVGGGNGTLLCALVQAHPRLRGVLVDRPGPVAAARRTFRAAGLDRRATAVPGSFFDELPAGRDVYVLSRVVNDWDDAHAIAILRRCAQAAGPRGRLLVFEEELPEFEGWADAEMDLRMLVYCGGRSRSLPALLAMAARAGLQPVADDVGGRLVTFAADGAAGTG